jgi:hypothetical protein
MSYSCFSCVSLKIMWLLKSSVDFWLIKIYQMIILKAASFLNTKKTIGSDHFSSKKWMPTPMAGLIETCYMHIICTSFVHQFLKLTIGSVGSICESLWENVRFITLIQQLYNNLSHKGGSHILGPTLMWGVVVQLLYWCCTIIKSHLCEFYKFNGWFRKLMYKKCTIDVQKSFLSLICRGRADPPNTQANWQLGIASKLQR